MTLAGGEVGRVPAAELSTPGKLQCAATSSSGGVISAPRQAAATRQAEEKPHGSNNNGPATDLARTQASAASDGASPGAAEGASDQGSRPGAGVGHAKLCGGINASAPPAMEAGTHITGDLKVPANLSRNRFIASELYRPEALNVPIRGAPWGRRSYSKVAWSHHARSNGHHQPPKPKPRWRPLLLSKTLDAPAGYKSSFTGRCYRCLGRDHKLAECRDPLRCLACRRNDHFARECPEKREGAHRPPIRSRLKFPPNNIHSRISFHKTEKPDIHSRLFFPPLPDRAGGEASAQEEHEEAAWPAAKEEMAW